MAAAAVGLIFKAEPPSAAAFVGTAAAERYPLGCPMQFWLHRRRSPLAVIGVFVAASCSDIPTVCTAELRVRTTPTSIQLSVGETVTVSVALSTCGGKQKLSDTFVWSADDTAIVRVDSSLARVTARQAGSTIVVGTGRVYGRVAYIPAAVIP